MMNEVSLQEKLHWIPLEQAAAMTANFRKQKEDLVNPSLKGLDVLPFCETYKRTAIDALLNLNDCVGLRIYLGVPDNTSQIHLILCGVNSKGEDIYLTEISTNNETSISNFVIEDGFRCPKVCPPPSALNS
jgi:hypothetical protein